MNHRLLSLVAQLLVPGGMAALLAGCGSYQKEENFIDRVAKESCDLDRKCYYAFYVNEYSDYGDCIDEKVEDLENLSDFLDDIDCSYDPEGALDCVAALKQAGRTCDDGDLEDASEACTDDIYDCD